MFKFFVKMDGTSVAINRDWIMSVSPELKDGQPCTRIWSDKIYWDVRETLANVVSDLNRE